LAKDGAKKMRSFVKQTSVFRIAEDVLGCKWSLTVLQLVRQGICRPGLIERSVEGLTTKVLNERLRKLTSYKILERHAYPEIPPRVEYRLTALGEKFVDILDQLVELDQDFNTEMNCDDRGSTNSMHPTLKV
jgi:DNA-binding HxlR family transcriptional regulator